MNSIHFEDSVLVTVIVNKQDGSIRIVIEGSSTIQEVVLQSGAKLEEADGCYWWRIQHSHSFGVIT